MIVAATRCPTACAVRSISENVSPFVSGMGGAAFATWILSSVADLSAVGTHALVARAAGARDWPAVRDAATQGAWLSLALGLVAFALAGPMTDGYFALVGFLVYVMHRWERAIRVPGFGV